MAPAARVALHDLVLRLSRTLQAKRTARDQAIAQLTSVPPEGADGTRPVQVIPPAPGLPPADARVPIGVPAARRPIVVDDLAF